MALPPTLMELGPGFCRKARLELLVLPRQWPHSHVKQLNLWGFTRCTIVALVGPNLSWALALTIAENAFCQRPLIASVMEGLSSLAVLTGHSDSSSFKNPENSCQTDPSASSYRDAPLVIRSAIINFPSTHLAPRIVCLVNKMHPLCNLHIAMLLKVSLQMSCKISPT